MTKPPVKDNNKWMLLGTSTLLLGLLLFSWGNKLSYMYATSGNAVERPAILGIFAFIFTGFSSQLLV